MREPKIGRQSYCEGCKKQVSDGYTGTLLALRVNAQWAFWHMRCFADDVGREMIGRGVEVGGAPWKQ